MSFSVRAVEYFYTRVEDDPGRAYDLLARMAAILSGTAVQAAGLNKREGKDR